MPDLSSHANVFETCLQILERRGYRLTRTLPEDDEVEGAYMAERDGFSFAADNPIELLGLVSIYEEVRPIEARPGWWSAGTVCLNVLDRLTDEAIALQESRHATLEELKRNDPMRWEAHIRQAFAEGFDTPNAASVLGITRRELERILEDTRLADLRSRARGRRA